MLAYIKGTVEYTSGNFAVIDNGGLGYKVYMPQTQLSQLPPPGGEAKVYTHLYVREDVFDLYGFLSKDELSMFVLLLSVSGVGPKAALNVLSALSPAQFALAVVTNDAKSITRAQGVGGKLAQRIILELKDKLKDKGMEADLPSDSFDIPGENSMDGEAISALVVLGYSAREAKSAVEKAEGDNLEDIIKSALKLLMK